MASIKAIAAIALTLIVAVPILMGYGMASTEATTTSWETESTTNVTELLYNHTTNYYAEYVGTTNNSMLSGDITPDYVSVSDTVTSYSAMTSTDLEITFVAGEYVDLSAYDLWSVVLPSGITWYWKYVTDGSSGIATGTTSSSNYTLSKSGGQLALSEGGTYTVTYYSDTDQYADITAGWKLPATNNIWLNNQTNSEVVFSVYLPSGSEVLLKNITLTNTDGTVTASYTYSESSTSSTTYTVPIGNYSYLRVVYNLGTYTISGLAEWPEYGTTPTLYNTVEIEYSSASEFTRFALQNDDQNAIFRVDSAQIVAGTYPTTYNLSFKSYIYYPDTSYTFTIKSVAAYGSAINIVKRDDGTTTGSSMTVTDGTVTYNDVTMKVRGLEITTLLNSDGTWNTYVNDELFWENTELQPYIDIWGYWSLTASLDVLTETTSTQQTWAPGEFAFDKEDFAACGLLVAGACLIGLGMTGSRSGIKMGVLLLICGAAGLIYLTIL